MIVSVDKPPGLTVGGVKAFDTERFSVPFTVKLSVRLPAGSRFSLFEILAGVMILVTVPGVLLVTQTSIRQRAPARMVPPVRDIDVAPVLAVSTRGGVAPQPLIAGGVATPAEFTLVIVTPNGRLSVMEKFVRFVSAGAKRSILNLVF